MNNVSNKMNNKIQRVGTQSQVMQKKKKNKTKQKKNSCIFFTIRSQCWLGNSFTIFLQCFCCSFQFFFVVVFAASAPTTFLHCSWWHPVSLCHSKNKRWFDLQREQKPLHKSVLIKNWPSIHNGMAACFTHTHTHTHIYSGCICLQNECIA